MSIQMEQLVVEKKKIKCSFCGLKKNDYIKYGPIYKLGNIRAHYYCVILSNQLQQKGDDDEGILGFLLPDIQNELRRTLNIFCTYCEKGNATIKCSAKKCQKWFHLPCGLRNGSLHQFVKDFRSFCRKHRPSQNIPRRILTEIPENGATCCICYDSANVRDKENVLWAPCCLKTWYHRICVQKLAHSAGYFFRCAACNDVGKFSNWMQRFGIFIPQQDASWERVPNAFEELLFRYDKCDAQNCKCPEGRRTNSENTMWELILCESCGSQGMHIACGNLKFLEPEWECAACQEVTKNIKASAKEVEKSIKVVESSSKLLKLVEASQKKRRRGSEDIENSVLDKRKKCRAALLEGEAEVDVDVETVEEDLQEVENQTEAKYRDTDIADVDEVESGRHGKKDLEEVLTSLKPGPLSYKLSLIREALVHYKSPHKRSKSVRNAPNVIASIELSDSEEFETDGRDIEAIGKENTEINAENSSDKQLIEAPSLGSKGDCVIHTQAHSQGDVIITSDSDSTDVQVRDRAASKNYYASSFIREQRRLQEIVFVSGCKYSKTDNSEDENYSENVDDENQNGNAQLGTTNY